MPHGRLTPLGRQLRSVLASIRHSSTPNHLDTFEIPIRPASCLPIDAAWRRDAARQLHTSPFTRQTAVAPALEDEEPDASEYAHLVEKQHMQGKTLDKGEIQDGRRFRIHGWRRLKRRGRMDHLTHALKATKDDMVTPYAPPGKRNLNYVNVRSRNAWQEFKERQRRHKDDALPDPAHSRELSLQRILASYIRHTARAADFLEAEWNMPFQLSDEELQYLEYKRVSIEDLAAWADILSHRNILDAALSLAARMDAETSISVPIFVLLYLLRRRYISARALRLLLWSSTKLLAGRLQRLRDPGIDNEPILILATRLIRHARVVWPQCLVGVVEMVLNHFRYQEQSRQPLESDKLKNLSLALNNIMGLISLQTAVRPFKDNPHQEAALVRILRYMAEHHPALQINRQGYRAVIRLQLAQKKTGKERQWAELKALSWPPWKHDRNAMDAVVEPEDHGTSKAAATLAGMRGAGYRPLPWEISAGLYAGWDTDKTPTIQTRALLGAPGAQLSSRLRGSFNPWVARIATTRTIQEAWAAYLTVGDAPHPLDQDVYLAILRKLYQHERGLYMREESGQSAEGVQAWSIQPGDVRELSPLPPSTHLHTYTRTPPPSVDGFYSDLRNRGVVFHGNCLAFLVQNANTLQSGLWRLRDSISHYPEIEGLLCMRPNTDLSRLPTAVFVAFIGLLVRFPNVPWPKDTPGGITESVVDLTGGSFFQDSKFKLNVGNPMARAVELLRRRPIPHCPLWNTILRSLTHEANFASLRHVIVITLTTHSERSEGTLNLKHPEARSCAGAMYAFRIVIRILSLAEENHIDIDDHGLHYYCLAVENMAVAGWRILQEHERMQMEGPIPEGLNDKTRSFAMLQRQATSSLRKHSIENRLKKKFRVLVGDVREANELEQKTLSASPGLPSLLTVPGPALLHAYIRALGWLGDHQGLLDTVYWMRDHEVELTDRQNMDRQGQNLMRKAIVALRVFLERGWIGGNDTAAAAIEPTGDDEEGEGAAPLDMTGRILLRIRSPASPELIDAAREAVESISGWQGWPTDEEVECYTRNTRFQRVHRL
ncbi:Hypothetical predicted protein [Lecanosticta acicola]|uniref:Uncharacterized protein n=1 Tax=Lecanosticta acicola TaxID=111012 RepID=A0AAI9EAJ2_9PEZI|nr:Hypothetical predicted protein [Lecanosticta acicola]